MNLEVRTGVRIIFGFHHRSVAWRIFRSRYQSRIRRARRRPSGRLRLKILSWNVNGLRARIKQGFVETIKALDPDVVCIQETRAAPKQLPGLFMLGYNGFFSVHEKGGYAGATTWVRKDIGIVGGDNTFKLGDEKGRVAIVEFERFVLINSYTPNSGLNLEKLAPRIEWESKLLEFIKKHPKPAILCGDLNVAPEPRDAKCKIKAGCSPQERASFKDILDLGHVDVWRENHQFEDDYTWFAYWDSMKTNGARLDHFVVHKILYPACGDVEIIKDPKLIAGSDHRPIMMEINIEGAFNADSKD